MQQATETLREARLLLETGSWRGSINRAYYAMFYAGLALLATRDLGTSKHTAVLSLFDREFVKQNILPQELSHVFHAAFIQRLRSDYGETADADQDVAEKTLKAAETFVKAAERLLATEGHLRDAAESS